MCGGINALIAQGIKELKGHVTLRLVYHGCENLARMSELKLLLLPKYLKWNPPKRLQLLDSPRAQLLLPQTEKNRA